MKALIEELKQRWLCFRTGHQWVTDGMSEVGESWGHCERCLAHFFKEA
jgi:hypothetical protein